MSNETLTVYKGLVRVREQVPPERIPKSVENPLQLIDFYKGQEFEAIIAAANEWGMSIHDLSLCIIAQEFYIEHEVVPAENKENDTDAHS